MSRGLHLLRIGLKSNAAFEDAGAVVGLGGASASARAALGVGLFWKTHSIMNGGDEQSDLHISVLLVFQLCAYQK